MPLAPVQHPTAPALPTAGHTSQTLLPLERAAAPLPTPPSSTTKVAAARARYARDGQATMSKPQLLVALYQRLCRDLVAAEAGIADRDFEATSRNLQHAQDIVLALEEALDRDAWAAAEQLGALYEYLYRRLLDANMTKDAATVRECRSHIEPLCDAWEQAANSVMAGGPAAQR